MNFSQNNNISFEVETPKKVCSEIYRRDVYKKMFQGIDRNGVLEISRHSFSKRGEASSVVAVKDHKDQLSETLAG